MKEISVNCIEYIPLIKNSACPKLIKEGYDALSNGSYNEAHAIFERAPAAAEASFGIVMARNSTTDASKLSYCALDYDRNFKDAISLSCGSFKQFLLWLQQLARVRIQSLECDAAAIDCNTMKSRIGTKKGKVYKELATLGVSRDADSISEARRIARKRESFSKPFETVSYLLYAAAGIYGLIVGFQYGTSTAMERMSETAPWLAKAIGWLIGAVLGAAIGAALFIIPTFLVVCVIFYFAKISSHDYKEKAGKLSNALDVLYSTNPDESEATFNDLLKSLRALTPNYAKFEQELSEKTEPSESVKQALDDGSVVINSAKAVLAKNDCLAHLNDEIVLGGARMLANGKAEDNVKAFKAYENMAAEVERLGAELKQKQKEAAKAEAAHGHSEYYDRKRREYTNEYLGGTGNSSAADQAKGAADDWNDLNQSGYWDDKSWQ